jgi:hypothetical protein
MNPAEQIEHAVFLMVTRAEYLVSQCELYSSRLADSPSDMVQAALSSLARPIQLFRESQTDRAKLEAAEKLADVIHHAIMEGMIMDRTLPDDALLQYRDPSGRWCSDCRKPDAHSVVNAKHICTRCLLALQW